jgi:hypothetical protein
MITESFIKGHEYQEFKQILGDTLLHKPIKIKTEGKTNEVIAREVASREMAVKLIQSAIRSFEKGVSPTTSTKQSFR